MRFKFKQVRKRTYLLIVLAGVILFYPLAIFIRADIVPFYANTFFRGSVNNMFNSSFTDFNNQFIKLGFNIPKPVSTCYNGISDSGNAQYDGVSETVLCTSKITSASFVPSTQFKANWEQAVPQLNARLKAENWQWQESYDDYPGTTLNNIYDAFNPQGYDQNLVYSKQSGKISCQLDIDYGNYSGRSATNSNTKADVSETCQRNVSFFGGSQG